MYKVTFCVYNITVSVLVAFAPSSGDLDTVSTLENEAESPSLLPAAVATTSPPAEKVQQEPGGVLPVEEPIICKGDISDFKADVEKGGHV